MAKISPENAGKTVEQVIESMVEILSATHFAKAERFSNHKLTLLLMRIVTPEAAASGKSSLRTIAKAIEQVRELEWLSADQITNLRARAFKYVKRHNLRFDNWSDLTKMQTNNILEKEYIERLALCISRENEPIHSTVHPRTGILTQKGLWGSIPRFGTITYGSTGTWSKDPSTGEHSMLVSQGNTFRWTHPWMNRSTVFEQNAYLPRRQNDPFEEVVVPYAKKLRKLRKTQVSPDVDGLITGAEVDSRIAMASRSAVMTFNVDLDVPKVLAATLTSNAYNITVNNWNMLGLTKEEQAELGFKAKKFLKVRQESVEESVDILSELIKSLSRNRNSEVIEAEEKQTMSNQSMADELLEELEKLD